MTTDSKSSNTNISGHVQADLKQLGKYKIVRKIGAGGMGTVFLAQDTHLNRTVALKVLPKDRAENPILVRRFQTEARASAILTHDNIVAVFDADKADGYLYIALEYIEGIDLYEWLKKRERIPVKRSIDIIKQVAAALQHAHEKNLVHRDIKPANIMITKDGLVKLADMGLARSVDESLDTTITRDGTTVGTVDYMSPEQAANSKDTDIRSDIYSLGCTWYHLLTGSPPFPEGSLMNKLSAHAKTPPPDPRDDNKNVSEAIVAIIHRMMAKKKEDRYQTPAELIKDINSSTNLESNSGNLLSMLLAEDELENNESSKSNIQEDHDFDAHESILDDDDDSSVDVEVQEESQATLLKKSKSSEQESTNSSVPQKKTPRRQKGKPKRSLPPKSQQSFKSKSRQSPAEQSEEKPPEESRKKTQEKPQTPAKRKPLKRVASREELQETNSSEQQKTKPATDSKPTKQKQPAKRKAEKNKNSKAAKSKPEKAQPTKTKQTQPDRQKAKPRKSVKEQPIEPQRQRRGPGIAIDWGRAGLVILIAALVAFGIWWGIKRSHDDSHDPVQNPYHELTENSTSPDTPPDIKTASEIEGEQANVVDVLVQPAVEKVDEKLERPQWVVAGWEKPIDDQRQTLDVRRGPKRGNSYRTLEQALLAVDSKTGAIDLSHLTYQPLTPITLKFKEKLKIVADNAQPVLAFNSTGQLNRSSTWLTVHGGTLELQGLNFVVTNLDAKTLEFIKLEGTDLILKDCTFTAIGEQPVHFFKVLQKSALSNRIYIENCLFRGENVSSVHVENVPCDLFCQNTFFASNVNQLFKIQLGQRAVTQKIQVSNCTLVGGNSTFSISRSPDNKSAGTLDLNVHRSLIIGQQESETTAFQLSDSNPAHEGVQQRPSNVSIGLLHTRFLNINHIGTVTSGADAVLDISNSSTWKNYWGTSLPVDDLIDNFLLSIKSPSFAMLTAADLEPQLQEVSRPGVGERSLLGVEATQVATVESTAVERQVTVNRFEALRVAATPSKWSDKTVRFDLKNGTQLNSFLASDKCPNGITVVCFGAGLRKISPIILKQRRLRLQFEQAPGTPLVVEPASDSSTTMFVVQGGELIIENGPFHIPKSRADKDGTLFLQSSQGARVQLQQSQVFAPFTSAAENQLMACLGNSKSGKRNVVVITNSMLSGAKVLLDFNATQQSLILKNSVLATDGDILALSAAQKPGLVLLELCTLAQGVAVIDCRGSQTPVETLVVRSVFAPAVLPSKKSCLVSGSSPEVIRQTLNWWEIACGRSGTIQTPVNHSKTALNGSFETAWQRFWGPQHIYDSLSGPQAVVLPKGIASVNNLKPADFELQSSGPSASWGIDGQGIGAQVETVGPVATMVGPKASKLPRTINTPAGF